MKLTNPYPGVEEILLKIETQQFGKETYHIPIGIIIEDIKPGVEDLEDLADDRGYDTVGQMVSEDFYGQVEAYVVNNSHEFW